MTDQPADPAPESPVEPISSAGATASPAGTPPRGFLRRWGWVIAALVVVVAIVIVLAPLASPDPDGLESIAGQQGWLGSARDALFKVFPDYSIPGLGGAAGTIVSGLIGVGIVFLVMLGLGWMLRRRKTARG